MYSSGIESNIGSDGYRNILSSSDVLLNLLISYFKEYNKDINESFFKKYNKFELDSFTLHTKMLCQSLITILKNEKIRSYLHIRMHSDNLLSKLSNIISFLAMNKQISVQDDIYDQFFKILNKEISSLYEWIDRYSEYIAEAKENEEKIRDLETKYQQALAHIHKTNSLKTEELYTGVSDEYLKRAQSYEAVFYLIFLGAFLFTIVHLCYVDYEYNKINYILVKVMTITFVVTLGTIFLRKAAHLRKLNDQAHQTSLELKALPLFLRNISPEYHSEIYRELATKYFGKELDQTQNDKIGDLMKDQLAAGTEFIKASAEMVKNIEVKK